MSAPDTKKDEHEVQAPPGAELDDGTFADVAGPVTDDNEWKDAQS